MIKVSAPGKIHLLGEHAVVYGKPALLATVNLRVTVTLTPIVIPAKAGIYTNRQSSSSNKDGSRIKSGMTEKLKEIIEPIVKKSLQVKKIPPYQLEIDSRLPIGSGLGSSAAISAAYIGALLLFLKSQNVTLNLFQGLTKIPKQVRNDNNNLDLTLINDLAYEAEKVFHGNPSGADNSTIVFGGLIWYRKEIPELKLIQQVPFSIPDKLAKNFVIINTGTPKQTTKEMVELVRVKRKAERGKFRKIFDIQEQLVKDLLIALKETDENKLIQIIRAGEKNLESIGVASKFAQDIIRKIEKAGGAAKICGAGASKGPTGVLLCYHPDPAVIKKIAKDLNLECFQTELGVEGVRKES